jgi:hypothetical protein
LNSGVFTAGSPRRLAAADVHEPITNVPEHESGSRGNVSFS